MTSDEENILKAAEPDLHSKAQKAAALSYVLAKTTLPEDCVSTQIVEGSAAIVIKHDAATEVCIHHTYLGAAIKAVEWYQAQPHVSTVKSTKLTRKQRRAFNSTMRSKLRKALRS